MIVDTFAIYSRSSTCDGSSSLHVRHGRNMELRQKERLIHLNPLSVVYVLLNPLFRFWCRGISCEPSI